MNWKEFLSSPQACIIALVLVFVAVRLFVPAPHYFVAVDEARYLGLAENFPSHTYYAGTSFLQHMPAYPYAVALIDFLVGNDVVSGLMVSFMMSALLLVVLLALFKKLKKKNTWLFLFALLFSLNWGIAELSRLVFKETTYMLFFWSTVAFFLLGLKKSKKWFWISGIFAGLTGLASDQVIFLFPIMLATTYLVPARQAKWHKYIPVVLGAAAYAFWLAIRIQFYISNSFAPVGVDGVIENVADFGPGQILNPFSFPASIELTRSGYLNNPLQVIGNLGYTVNTYPFLIEPNLSRFNAGSLFSPASILFILVWYIPLAVLAVIWLWRTGKRTVAKKNYKNNLNVLFAVYLAFLVLPILTGVGNWRHIVLAFIPIIYFETQVLFMLFKKFMEKEPVRIGFALIAAVFVIVWVFTHPHFSFASEKVVQGYGLAEELKGLPEDGIFVQTGYSMEIAHLLPEKRVYGLVADYKNLTHHLGFFNITYVVTGNKTWAPAKEPSLEYIKARPDFFIPLKKVYEDYPLENAAPDVFTVYHVNQSLIPRGV